MPDTFSTKSIREKNPGQGWIPLLRESIERDQGWFSYGKDPHRDTDAEIERKKETQRRPNGEKRLSYIAHKVNFFRRLRCRCCKETRKKEKAKLCLFLSFLLILILLVPGLLYARIIKPPSEFLRHANLLYSLLREWFVAFVIILTQTNTQRAPNIYTACPSNMYHGSTRRILFHDCQVSPFETLFGHLTGQISIWDLTDVSTKMGAVYALMRGPPCIEPKYIGIQIRYYGRRRACLME